MNEHLAKHTEKGYPENTADKPLVNKTPCDLTNYQVQHLQHDPIPWKKTVHSEERHCHDQRRNSRERAYNDSKDEVWICIFVC